MLNIHWETLDALVQGKSPIDLSSMPTKSKEEAKALVYQCGYDLDNPQEALEVETLFRESVQFLENRFLTDAIDWQSHGEAYAPENRVPINNDWLSRENLIFARSFRKQFIVYQF